MSMEVFNDTASVIPPAFIFMEIDSDDVDALVLCPLFKVVEVLNFGVRFDGNSHLPDW